ncbi:MAG: magnesium protoporphyrin IX methyltransferase [Rhodobacteraceae bacterium]|nr:magnesium protoporphyrin IX methyltransferase [Paracoccaceae bacterium]
MIDASASYTGTRDRVEDYFDRTATRVWERLTSDAPVSRIRRTVRAGRERMRATMLACLPADLAGARVLDAGCGAGQMCAELAARGATVVGADISPALIAIAGARLAPQLRPKVTFVAGDMLSPELGAFDHVVAMDSLIYYSTPDIADALARLAGRTRGSIVFTLAPRTPLLTLMWRVGRLFPRADRSPLMVPQDHRAIARAAAGRVRHVARVSSGFYISDCLEHRA